MAENELVKDDLAIEEAFQVMVENQIAIAELKGETEATVKLNDGGKATVTIKIEKIQESGEYTIYMQGHYYASRKNEGKNIKYNYRWKLKAIDDAVPEFNIKESIRVHNLKMQQENNESTKLQSELEQAKKDERAEPIRTGREITSGEDLAELTNRMFGEKMHEVYRIRDEKDAHSFKYVGLKNDGKYTEFGGSTKHEGTNPGHKVYILTTTGKLEEKTVDHLMTNGKYAIATDIPDSAIADRTRTLVGNRLPSGRYLFIEALDSRNASASNNLFVKNRIARGESQYHMEEVADVMELSQKIEALKLDGLIQAEELELVINLRNEGYNSDEIVTVINFIHTNEIIHDLSSKELDNTKIRAILDSTETTANQIEEMEKAHMTEEQQLEVFSKMYDSKKGCISFEQAFSEVKNGTNFGDDEDVRKKENEEEDNRLQREHERKLPWEPY